MKFKVGRLYFIEFNDHCIGYTELVLCQVSGWVVKETKDSVVLTFWNVVDQEVKGTMQDPEEPVVIAKATIKKKRKLTIPKR